MNNPNVVTFTLDESGNITNVTGIAEANRRIDEMTDEKLAEYKRAFDLVCNKENWKREIDCILVESDVMALKVYRDAIAWFTGSMARIERVQGNTWRITADGYYKTIGA